MTETPVTSSSRSSSAVSSIGSGLAVGQEGPRVHIGAAIGGSGLAVVLNAPLCVALFVFEEVADLLVRMLNRSDLYATGTAGGLFSPLLAVAALGSVALAAPFRHLRSQIGNGGIDVVNLRPECVMLARSGRA